MKRHSLALLLLLLPGLAAPAHAAAGGSTLPFNEPITRIIDNLTGPTANAIIVAVIFAGLLTLALGRDQGWLKTIGGAVVIGALMAKAATLPGILGLSTATAETFQPGAALLLAGALFLLLVCPLVLLRERRSSSHHPTARA
jgi:type IV secretory pathway VirB2 component (pilin)